MENTQPISPDKPLIKKGKWVVIAIFIVAMLLRLVPGLLNSQANDNHIDVVNLIIATHKLPEKNDCWSCYQPKLYYVICAVVVKAFNVNGNDPRIRVMEQVNVFISFFILFIFWKFIDKQNLKDRSKYVLFAFFACNPCLTGINVQGTNDTLVIFFGVLATYACSSFFEEYKTAPAILLITALVGGMLTKASCIIIAGVVCIAFIIKLLTEKVAERRTKAVKYFLILLVVIGTIVPFAGGYYHNYKQYGSLSLSTWDKDTAPYFFKQTPITRPGLRSMFDCYFTFRYADMIRQPYINNDWKDYPEHRTSLWSQLYGRTVFMHFDQWPPGWQSTEPYIVYIGRALILLGIVPLLLFCAGILKNTIRFFRKLLKMDVAYLSMPGNYIYLFITLAFLFSSMYYTYNYRDFSSMKSIYIFPGFLAFIKMFIDGFQLLRSKKIVLAVHIILTLMVVFSIADIFFLANQLYLELPH